MVEVIRGGGGSPIEQQPGGAAAVRLGALAARLGVGGAEELRIGAKRGERGAPSDELGGGRLRRLGAARLVGPRLVTEVEQEVVTEVEEWRR
jgi:hypothetical protein